MNAPQSICAFYSHGPHFRRLLGYLREQYPDASITAVVPPRYPQERLDGLATRVEKTDQARYGVQDVPALWRLRRHIADAGYDMIVVMFDSPRLRLLAASTRIPQRYCYAPNRRFHPIRTVVWTELLRTARRRVGGWLTYRRVRWVVLHRRVRDAEPPIQ